MIGRVAFLSVHTSPLAAPGTGDAGGMNVYVDSVARTFAERGISVDVFTADLGGATETVTDVAAGYRVVEIPVQGANRAERISDFYEAIGDEGEAASWRGRHGETGGR